MKGSINLQGSFLNKLKKENVDVTIYLINGYQIKGFIKGYDNYIIIIEDNDKQQMIYKHAISTIIPNKKIKLTQSNADQKNN